MADANRSGGVRELIGETHKLLVSLRSGALEPFLSDWPDLARLRPVAPAALPVLRWLAETEAGASGATARLVREVIRTGPGLSWRQTYKAPTVQASFLERYGWTEIIGLAGPAVSERIACGFLLLGPHTLYPSHRHEAEEVYVPLAGRATWQQGAGSGKEHAPGTLIHHSSDEPHAMQTQAGPLLALYLWRSSNLNQQSRLDPPPGS